MSYRTSDNKIEGAVLVLVDIGDMRNAIDEISEMTLEPMLILDDHLRVAKLNEPFCRTFEISRSDVEGKSIFEIGNERWNVPGLRILLERVLPENKRVEDYRIEHAFKSGHSAVRVSARKLYQHSKGTHYVVMRFDLE